MTPEIEGTLELDAHYPHPDDVFLAAPEWFWDYEGNVSVKTPHATILAYNVREHSRRPLEGRLLLRHFIDKRGEGEQNPELNPDLIALKPWGGERRFYRVRLSETIEEMCGIDADALEATA